MFRSFVTGFFAVALTSWIVTAQTPKPGRLEGSVTNKLTGAPLKKATVFMNGPQVGNLSSTTDANGHFSFENVQPGSYLISPQCPGYSQGANKTVITPVNVAEQQEITNLKLEMTPNGVVAGRVLDEDGDPLAHVQILALHYTYNQGRRQLNQGGYSSTNDLGEFRILDLSPGRYFFQATPLQVPGRNLPARTVKTFEDRAYPVTFYPNSMDMSQSTGQIVNAGAELDGIEFHLKKTTVFHVRGTATDAQATQPSQNLFISLSREGQMGSSGVRVGNDGTFDLPDVAPGQYTITAMKNEMGGSKVARQPVTVGSHDVDGLTLSLQPGFKITGFITVEGPPSTGRQKITQVFLGPPGLMLGMSGRSAGAVKDDGAFELPDVLPGIYAVNVSGSMEGKYLRSIEFADKEVTDGTIDLTQQRGGAMHLVYGADPGRIRGTTSPGVLVTAAPPADVPARADQFHTTFSDGNGNFQFQDLAPGDYRIMAWESRDMNTVQSSELRKSLESGAASVTLAPGGNESVQVKSITAWESEGALQKLP